MMPTALSTPDLVSGWCGGREPRDCRVTKILDITLRLSHSIHHCAACALHPIAALVAMPLEVRQIIPPLSVHVPAGETGYRFQRRDALLLSPES